MNPMEVLRNPEDIAASRDPDKVDYTPWLLDRRYQPDRFVQRRDVRSKIETWFVPALRIPYLLEPITIIAGDELTIQEARYGIRDLPASTIVRRSEEFRYYEVRV